jgi:hypothetical protein
LSLNGQCPNKKIKNKKNKKIFEDEKIQKKPTNIQNCPSKKILSDLVIKQVNLLIFKTML